MYWFLRILLRRKQRRRVKLVPDIVHLIVSYIYDFHTLRMCSMVCRMWYIAAAPRLHYSLTICNEPEWQQRPQSLKKKWELGLSPLVKQLHFKAFPFFTFGRSLDWGNLEYFNQLKNLRELRIDRLKLTDSLPQLRWGFYHCAETLQSLALDKPEGSCMEVLFFIGLFKNLQDFALSRFISRETGDNLALKPFAPPLRGRLTLEFIQEEKFVQEMINLYRGLPFRYVHLSYTKCRRLVLDACKSTLQTLRLDHDAEYGECLDLSQLSSLRTLEFPCYAVTTSTSYFDAFLETVLLTVSSDLTIIIIYNEWFFTLCAEDEFHRGRNCVTREGEQRQLFTVLRRALSQAYNGADSRIPEIRLVLCAEITVGVGVEQATGILERSIEDNSKREESDYSYILHGATVISRMPRIDRVPREHFR